MSSDLVRASSPRKWIVLAAVLIAGVLVAVLINKLMDEVRDFPQRHARESMRRQIAGVQPGKRNVIFVYGDEQSPFLGQMGDLVDIGHFELVVEYGNGTDEFLKQIAELSGVESLTLGKNDVTDAGMQYVAVLPDLKSLTLYEVAITDAGLEELKQSAHLEELYLAPRHGTEAMIPAALALPQLRKLTLCNGYQNPWVEAFPRYTDDAQKLDELSLTAAALDAQQLAALRAKLPNCEVKALKHD